MQPTEVDFLLLEEYSIIWPIHTPKPKQQQNNTIEEFDITKEYDDTTGEIGIALFWFFLGGRGDTIPRFFSGTLDGKPTHCTYHDTVLVKFQTILNALKFPLVY